MGSLDNCKEQIRTIQHDSLQKTREIIQMIYDTEEYGATSIKMLDEQREQLERCANHTETINANLEKSSNILGRIKHFFFPRKACKIEKIPEHRNLVVDDGVDKEHSNGHEINSYIGSRQSSNSRKMDVKIKSEFVDKDIEEEIDNNLHEINLGVQNLKHMALDINKQLEDDARLLERVNTNSAVINRNINKMNKEINKVL